MKRHESLSALSSDHHKGLSIAKLLRSAGGLPQSETENIYIRCKEFFETELNEHFTEEESFLVPPLSENDLIKKMCADHVKIRELYNSIKAADNPGASLVTLGEHLENHIRFEERILFPMIEKTLSEEKLLEICSMISDRRKTV